MNFTLPLARSSVARYDGTFWPDSEVKSAAVRSDATRYLRRIARIDPNVMPAWERELLTAPLYCLGGYCGVCAGCNPQ